jgi:hypothetical protein
VIQPQVLSKNQQYDNGLEDYYMYFDSYYKNKNLNISQGALSFSISLINNNKPIENIIQMQIERIYIPTPVVQAGSAELLYFRQVFLQITTLPTTQGVLTSNSSVYHFEFDVGDTNSLATLLTPVNNIINFTRPLTSLDTLSLKFLIPPLFKPLPLPEDNLFVQLVLPGSNPAVFQVLGNTTSHIGQIGVLAPNNQVNVYLYNIVTDNATFNNSASSTYGVKITNILTSTTFEVASLDSTLVTSSTNNIDMLIGKNRIAFAARFTTITSNRTNYLSATRI